ncbi:hypothetical protein [Luteibacter yeojuensis]|uniref:P-type conjugative transfer protein TrbJ n=1 Tax=Luteibacter yeojuensis TaxID=345309 RepID=A0A7X5QW07_9GAMM|nr:hypothetical protein [Luteibacter yeojuensis]NID16416.1 hypothetical protein [Luteibacter yeojuensis]
MKANYMKRNACALALAGALVAGPTHAVTPVFDMAVFASNVAQNFQLTGIHRQLADKESGTINYYTNNIDKSTLSINKSTTNIDKSTTAIKNINKDILNVNTEINKNIEFNTEIYNEFTWIINKGGDEIIPIPFKDKLAAIMDGQSTDDYVKHYKTVEDHAKAPASFGDKAAIESSRARKAANDALVATIADDEAELLGEVESIKELADLTATAEGHGRQLQVANALSGSQINQLMKIRSTMLAAESARVAEAQASADREARAVAVGIRLREGLDTALSMKPLEAY